MAEDAKATPTKLLCWPDDLDYFDGFIEFFQKYRLAVLL